MFVLLIAGTTYGFGGLLTRHVYQAEHYLTAFIKLVFVVMYLVLLLDLQLIFVGFYHGLSCESLYLPVFVHGVWDVMWYTAGAVECVRVVYARPLVGSFPPLH